MSPLVFPYSYHKGRSLPIVPVGLKGSSDQWWKFNAYLDSGAFYSIFDADVCELLQLPLSKGRKMTAIVGDGDSISFYLHKIFLQIGKDAFEMEMGFSKSLGVGFNILGLDIFNKYEVTFNNRLKIVSLKSFK